MKKEKNIKRGKKSRAAGARFELKVRKDLESKRWIAAKWTNNVKLDYDLEVLFKKVVKGKLVPAKHKFRGKGIPMAMGTGFPDFIAYCKSDAPTYILTHKYFNIKKVRCDCAVIAVECKSNGFLTKEEHAKCKWLLENNVFSKILVAQKGEKRGKIDYKEFEK